MTGADAARRGRHRAWSGGSPGASRLGLLGFLLFLGVGGYLASLYVPPYWTYWSLRDPVRLAADLAAKGDEAKARENIIEVARSFDLELTEEDIEIIPRETHVVVRVSWTVPIDLPTGRRTLRFTLENSSPLL